MNLGGKRDRIVVGDSLRVTMIAIGRSIHEKKKTSHHIAKRKRELDPHGRNKLLTAQPKVDFGPKEFLSRGPNQTNPLTLVVW